MSYVCTHNVTNATNNCAYSLYEFDEDFIRNHFPEEVRAKLYDQEETGELVNEFSDVDSTDFEKDALKEVFTLEFDTIEPWRIGEDFTEYFLEIEIKARFWYNHLRDLKNPNSNTAGADLVGFIDGLGETIFFFGEVKTSGDESRPPQVMYSRTGLAYQLESLRQDVKKKNALVRYLGSKVRNLPEDNGFKIDYKNAKTKYMQNKRNVMLCGVLVRDTECDIRDLKARYNRLNAMINTDDNIKLFGLYIPIKIEEWKNII